MKNWRRDEWFDENQFDAIRLEYRSVGASAWAPLRRGLGSQLYWNPETNGVLEVRLKARGRAGNSPSARLKASISERASTILAGLGPSSQTSSNASISEALTR